MTSTQSKIERLSGMLGTKDLNEREASFVQKLHDQAQVGHVSRLSDPQLDWLTDLYNKHFGD